MESQPITGLAGDVTMNKVAATTSAIFPGIHLSRSYVKKVPVTKVTDEKDADTWGNLLLYTPFSWKPRIR